MIQRLKENTWIKAVAIALAAIAVLAAWSWMAGCLFMLVNKARPVGVLPQTYWTYIYYYHTEKRVMQQLLFSGALPIAAFVFATAKLLQKKRALHGEARFATRGEVAAAGLLTSSGLIVGQYGSRFLMSDGPFHVLLAAPTRSGKGVGVVIPNLLNFGDSVVVLDIKQENWDLTAGFRQKHGQACFLFNPAARDFRTHRWNPLEYVSRDEHFRVDDLQKIASMLWPETQGNEGFWDQLAGSLFLGISLLVMTSPELPFTIGECLRQSMKPNLQKRFMKIIAARRAEDNPLPEQCVHALTAFAGRSENTTASILSTYQAKLNIWLNPVVDAATSANDFDLRDLRRKPMSIYLGITPDNLARLAPVVNLFFQQIIDLQMRKLPEQDPTLKYKVLLLMDEFTAMGKVSILAESIAYVAGYGLRLLPIVQSTAQIIERYGQHQAENFIENHAVRIVFAPESIKIAKELSETLGYQTVKSTNVSKQVGIRARVGLHNESESDQRRALLLPQELMSLGQNKEIVFNRGTKPILAKKVFYYKKSEFTSRICPAPAVPLLTLNSRPADHPDNYSVDEVNQAQPESRSITVEDLPNLDTFTLDQFTCDFSDIEIPSDPVSDEDIEALTDAFFAKLSNSTE